MYNQSANPSMEQAAREVQPWLRWFLRFGYTAKGIVYIVIGMLALQVALGTGGETTDSTGALQRIAQEPFGEALLWLIGIGLVFYALWRFAEAGFDPDNKGSDAKGVVQRVGYAISGLIYGGLAFTAFQIVTGSGSGSSGDSSTQGWTARLMSQPAGPWLVGIVGLIVIGLGMYHIYEGATSRFRKKLSLHDLDANQRQWAIRTGQVGLIARGIVFGIIGWFLIQAAYQAEPSEARGLDGALTELLQQPFGVWLLGAVAIGLVAYGAYQFMLARYRRVPAQ